MPGPLSTGCPGTDHAPSTGQRALTRVPRWLLALVAVVAALVPLSIAEPAHAAARVSIANQNGDAVIDATYATTLTVSGSGFQSITNGHGGIYVFFGTVSSGWQPSQGGRTGAEYFYVPDSESADNQGFQKYVAFPGSDTASSANGGSISSDGSWSTTVNVPGATFTAYDRSGGTREINCAESTCGIITIGAHGVSNSANETFTPVTVGDLYGGEAPAAESEAGTSTGSAAAASGAGAAASAAPSAAAAAATDPTLEVDRGSAVAGRVLAFRATGLPAGQQVTATFDDGAAGAGPFQVGNDGTMAGVITIPEDTTSGTHELRIYGLEEELSVNFAVQESADAAAADDGDAWWQSLNWYAVAFVVFAALVLLAALLRLVLLRNRKAVR